MALKYYSTEYTYTVPAYYDEAPQLLLHRKVYFIKYNSAPSYYQTEAPDYTKATEYLHYNQMVNILSTWSFVLFFLFVNMLVIIGNSCSNYLPSS